MVQNLDDLGWVSWDLLLKQANFHSGTLSQGPLPKAIPIVTTRGCPGQCSFCCAHCVSGRTIRYRSPPQVLKEMLWLQDAYGIRTFSFQDNCFTSNEANLHELCEGMIQERTAFTWDCPSYQNLNTLTEETLPLMKRAGCTMIHLGIESASPTTRSLMRKKTALEEITSTIQRIKGHGIGVGAWFMLGFPQETRRAMEETIRYALSLPADFVSFTPCFPLPGTELFHHLQKTHGIESIDWASFDLKNSPYPLSEVSSRGLIRLVRMARYRQRVSRYFRTILR